MRIPRSHATVLRRMSAKSGRFIDYSLRAMNCGLFVMQKSLSVLVMFGEFFCDAMAMTDFPNFNRKEF